MQIVRIFLFDRDWSISNYFAHDGQRALSKSVCYGGDLS